MSFQPTDEQLAVADACESGVNLKVQAAAGAGKTSTLKLAAARMRGRGTYLTYNSVAAKEAKGAFPSRVRCSTIHGLAFGPVGSAYADLGRVPFGDKGAKRQKGSQVAEILGITDPVMIDASIMEPHRLGALTIATLDNWCLGTDYQPSAKHVPVQKGLSETGQAYLADVVVPWAHKAWLDVYSKDGRLNVKHDYYLRMWWNARADNRPLIHTDWVALDEAQDANGLAAAILQHQATAQLIAVGDSYQSLYTWRGAVDAIKRWPADQELFLRQSFRFGQPVADEANKWLEIMGAKMRVVGTPGRDCGVTTSIPLPDAVLCRTNAGAMAAVMDALENERRPALAAGAGEIKAFALAAEKLQNGQRCGHPELWAFSNWEEVQVYVDVEDEGSDLQMMVGLIDAYSPATLIDVVDNRLTSPRNADVVMSTVHGAKGLEWGRVQIGDDFRDPGADDNGRLNPVPKELGMCAYVAVTRPKELLGRGSLMWIDTWLRANLARTARPEQTKPDQTGASR